MELRDIGGNKVSVVGAAQEGREEYGIVSIAREGDSRAHVSLSISEARKVAAALLDVADGLEGVPRSRIVSGRVARGDKVEDVTDCPLPICR